MNECDEFGKMHFVLRCVRYPYDAQSDFAPLHALWRRLTGHFRGVSSDQRSGEQRCSEALYKDLKNPIDIRLWSPIAILFFLD